MTIDLKSALATVRFSGANIIARVVIIAILTMATWVCAGSAGREADSMDSLEMLIETDSRTLIDEAVRQLTADTLHNEAGAALAMVAGRYYNNPYDSTARHDAAIALRHMGNLCMSYFIDYRKAYKNLYAAKQIATEDKLSYELAYICMSLSNLYYFNDLPEKGREYLTEAAKHAIDSHNDNALAAIGVNIAFISSGDKSRDSFSSIYGPMVTQLSQSRNEDAKLASDVLRACEYYLKGNYSNAEKLLLQSLENLNTLIYSYRYFNCISQMLSHLYISSGQPEKAIAAMKTTLEMAKKEKHTDIEMYLYGKIANIYENMGEQDSMSVYYNKYLALEADLTKQRGLGSVEKMDLLSEIEKINEEVEQLSLKQQIEKRRRIVIMFILAIVIIVAVFISCIYANLRKSHKNLFRLNEEMMRKEESLNLLRRQQDEEIKRMGARLMELESGMRVPKSEETATPSGCSAITGNASGEKAYTEGENAGSNILTEEEEEDKGIHEEALVKIYSKCLSIMDTSDEIFNQGFSLNDLAHLVKSPSHAVSKAINVCHQTNFRQFLNEYRIREVTRIMHDSDSTQFTIEALAQRAGFKSRPSFVNLFKSVTEPDSLGLPQNDPQQTE